MVAFYFLNDALVHGALVAAYSGPSLDAALGSAVLADKIGPLQVCRG